MECQCTQEKCSWVVPPYQKTIPYAPVCEIDFSSVKNKKKAIDAAINCPGPVPEGDSNLVTPAQIQRQQESGSSIRLQAFYSELSKCGCKPAILSLVTEHAHMYIPKSSSPNYPKPLQSLYDPKFLKLGYTDLLSTCAKVDLHVNEDMVSAVESATRDQSKSKLWFKYRAGRITASKMKLACKSDPGLPSQSLIKTICYPEAFGFTTKATKWSCEHERVALDSYIKANTEKHDDFEVSKSGLFLSCDWPFIGASPDGLVNCSCCGKGVVEIKCSYCYRFDSVEKVATDRQSCLVVDADGVLHLSTSHAYYYQVQTQIHVCKVDYCDFCLCTFPSEASLHIERIFQDDQFWQACVDSSQCFFNICVLPELLGSCRWYSRPHSSVGGQQQTALATCMPIVSESTGASSTMTSLSAADAVQLYCYCKKPDDPTEEWIGCDNSACTIEWFHLKCLKMVSIPKGQWYCPDCRILPVVTMETDCRDSGLIDYSCATC